VADGFSIDCRRCPRLTGFLEGVRREHPQYYSRPVPSFGDPRARLLVVGLAPGLHGANASGRPFTGDHAGMLLYRTLHEFGFATAAESRAAGDSLRLIDCRITNAVRCVPPQNKPTAAEIRTCNPYLSDEISGLPRGAVILALGRIAHDAVLRALGVRTATHTFGHAAEHRLLNGIHLVDSFHCSRYNTNTRRLTGDMFRAAFAAVSRRLAETASHDTGT